MWDTVIRHKQEEVDPRKKKLFCNRKICSGHQTGSKIVPDLVEYMESPTHLVTEELWRVLEKRQQFRDNITNCTLWMSGKSTDSRRRPTQPASLVGFKPIPAPQFGKPEKIRKKYWSLARLGPNLKYRCRSTPFPCCSGLLFAIFGRASGPMFKNMQVWALAGAIHY